MFSLFVRFFTSARYTIFGVRHLLCSGQLSLDLQLQPYSVFETGFKIFLLCDEMMDEMLPIQLKLTFTVLFIKNLFKLLPFGKFF